jgi:hypothetical protein
VTVTSPVSQSKVRTEFGGASPPANLKAYNKGGTYVPSNTTTANVATDPNLLRLSQFDGASNNVVSVTLSNHTVYGDDNTTSPAAASVSLNNTGTFTWSSSNGGGSFAGQWMSGDTASNYEVLATTTAGTAGTGTVGTWLNLGTTRTWQRTRALVGITTWTFTLQIRAVGTTTVLASCTISLQAEAYGAECVVLGSWMGPDVKIGQIREGDLFTIYRPDEGFSLHPVEQILKPKRVPCVQLITESGASLRCSTSTPFNLRTATVDKEDGHWLWAPDMEGHEVMVKVDENVTWQRVVSVKNIGEQWVLPVSFGGRSFAAGDYPDALIYSHNMAKVIR